MDMPELVSNVVRVYDDLDTYPEDALMEWAVSGIIEALEDGYSPNELKVILSMGAEAVLDELIESPESLDRFLEIIDYWSDEYEFSGSNYRLVYFITKFIFSLPAVEGTELEFLLQVRELHVNNCLP